ncbi:Hypothetical protein, putative [Bodo saltans]|uniref:Uncharacterized protein n=1 Tax=Bodo saltans TaxID=75058 RepID=A0A0S4IRV8_BODSA|nr:Hypothetical protein, putative [Bodo saltans]|eukprot:CUE76256.1 Hypothetical protein, putative [Bodo saltans]
MDHCETVQVVHSPTMTFAVRRQNRAKLYDRAVPINLRCCGFDGPSYQCEEYFCMANQTGSYRAMGKAFVNFFSGLEPSFVLKRFVAYFRHGADDHKYLLFTSSVRIVERIDPEPDALWGKKPIAHAALKQSLQSVSTTWNAGSTGGASTPGAHDSGLQPGGAIGGKLLQPLTLIPQEQLDRIATVPSRAKEMEALSKQYKMEKHRKVRAVPPISRRLLSPFQTITADDSGDVFAQEDVSTMSQKINRIKEIRKRAAAVDKENDEINKRLQLLERDAASLCMMNELDKIARRRRSPSSPVDRRSPSSDDGELSFDGDETFGRRFLDRSASVVSTLSDSRASVVGATHIPEELLEAQQHSKSAQGGRGQQSGAASPIPLEHADGHLSRVASTVAAAGRMRKRKSMSLAKQGNGRPSCSPRSYGTRGNVLALERMLDSCGHRHVLERSKVIMDCAALLSDLFYPLSETVSVRRTRIPKYMKYEQTYGEEEGIIRVNEADGSIEFDIPRSILLTAQRELGAYWGALRIEVVPQHEISPDCPEFPSSGDWDLWQEDLQARKQDRIEAANASVDGQSREPLALDDEQFPFPSRAITCVVKQPYPNPSAFTFASRKLQEVAESLDKEYRHYAQKAVHAAKQFSHFELAEAIADAWTARSKREGASSQPTGGTPPSQELNPAANRARRASMLQQLRSLPRQASSDPLGITTEKSLGITPRSDGSAPTTPKGRRASSTPSEDALGGDVAHATDPSPDQTILSVDSVDPLGTAPSRRQAEGERRPTAVFILPEESDASPPTQDLEEESRTASAEESRTASTTSPPPQTIQTPPPAITGQQDDVPEWLR